MSESLGEMINIMETLDLQIKERDKATKLIKEQRSEYESKIMRFLEDQGLTSGSGKLATVSLTEEVTGTPYDWEVIYKYVVDNDAWFLFPRRILSAPYRELMKATGGDIPGIKPFTKKKLSMRRKP